MSVRATVGSKPPAMVRLWGIRRRDRWCARGGHDDGGRIGQIASPQRDDELARNRSSGEETVRSDRATARDRPEPAAGRTIGGYLVAELIVSMWRELLGAADGHEPGPRGRNDRGQDRVYLPVTSLVTPKPCASWITTRSGYVPNLVELCGRGLCRIRAVVAEITDAGGVPVVDHV